MFRVITVTVRESPEAYPRPTTMLITAPRQMIVRAAATQIPLCAMAVWTVTSPFCVALLRGRLRLAGRLNGLIETSPRVRLGHWSLNVDRSRIETPRVQSSGLSRQTRDGWQRIAANAPGR